MNLIVLWWWTCLKAGTMLVPIICVVWATMNMNQVKQRTRGQTSVDSLQSISCVGCLRKINYPRHVSVLASIYHCSHNSWLWWSLSSRGCYHHQLWNYEENINCPREVLSVQEEGEGVCQDHQCVMEWRHVRMGVMRTLTCADAGTVWEDSPSVRTMFSVSQIVISAGRVSGGAGHTGETGAEWSVVRTEELTVWSHVSGTF